MRGKRYLAKNMFFLTVGQFGTKLLGFFLVPLYTSILSSAEYGTYDLYSVTVSLLVPILTLNIADSTTVFLLDKDSPREGIVSVSLKYYARSVLLFAALVCANRIIGFFPLLNAYPAFLLLMFALSGLSQLLLNFARGFDRIKDVAVSGVLCSAVMIALNIVLLIPLRMGLAGYYLAFIGGALAQSAYLCVSLRIFRFIRTGRQDKKLRKDMLAYSCPMMLNSVSWWVNSVSDRYVVTWLCGIVQNGIYSVAYKIPSILNMFQGIFSQAWTLSAVQDFDRDDRGGFFSKMYGLYNACMTCACSLLIACARPMALLLYANDFYAAWRFVPFLLVASVFGALSGYLGGIFAAVKDSKSFAASTVAGAALNIVLTVALVWLMGTIGAAIATAAAYILVWAMRMRRAKRIMRLNVSIAKDCTAYALLVVQCAVVLADERFAAWAGAMNGIIFMTVCVLYRKNFMQIAAAAGKRLASRKQKQAEGTL
ncbi:MAG: oligosaccharide flippase family protein [Treponemataceae bacterium]|nr:oligosaccharide flippase family protein [Treponemataceae bacterium]